MSIVKAFGSETMVEFIQREGAVTTQAVAHRFGMDIRDALKALNKLKRAGLVESRREIFDYCAMNGWRATPHVLAKDQA